MISLHSRSIWKLPYAYITLPDIDFSLVVKVEIVSVVLFVNQLLYRSHLIDADAALIEFDDGSQLLAVLLHLQGYLGTRVVILV